MGKNHAKKSRSREKDDFVSIDFSRTWKTLGRFTMKLIFEWDKIVSHGGQFSRFAVRSELIERRGEPCLCAVDIFLHLFPSPQLGRKCDQSVNMTNTFSFFTQLLQLLPVNSF